MFLWNILLAFTWAAVTGHFNLSNVLVGMILGILFYSWRNRSWGGPATSVESITPCALRGSISGNLSSPICEWPTM